MKKVLAIILSIILLLPCFPAMAENGINIIIDGETKIFDVMPIIDNSRTLVPLRGIFEALGAQVAWNGETSTVTATKGDTAVVLQIGNPVATVSGKEVTLDVPAKIVEGRTLVPVRFVSESLGCKVDWIGESRTVVITSQAQSQVVVNNKVKELLDGKKVIIIGNSYVYYGNCVIPKARTAYTWADRSHDKGYFYQLCKENGAEVEVVNWCFTGHTMYNTFDGACDGSVECKGVFHESHLEDKYFDYVIVSPHASAGEEQNIAKNFDYIMNFFREANPNVKFVCLGNHAVYGITNKKTKFPGISNYYQTLKEEKGVIIADWGALVKGILDGGVVPGATQEYSINTFVNNKDGYHENALSGYLTALTAFCAITGESAVGQPYKFCGDASLGERYDLVKYRKQFYKSPEDTNFLEVFNSEADMKGLQKLVDWLFI